MKIKNFLIAFAAIIAVMLTACSSDEPGPVQEEEIPGPAFTDLNLSEAEGRANAGLEAFNIQFFQAAVAANPGENIAVSPLGASMMLSLVANIVDNDLRGQILTSLGCNDLSAINTLNRRYMDVLPTIDPSVTMAIANGCWYSENYTISPEFDRLLSESYDGESRSGDFTGNAQGVTEDINAWVNDRTGGMIPRIITDARELHQLLYVLISASYINGAWSVPFDPEDTKTEVFHGEHGDSNVDMMRIMHELQIYNDGGIYGHKSNWESVKIFLGDGKYSVTFVLPHQGFTIDDIIAEGKFCSSFDPSGLSINFYLPRMDFKGDKLRLNPVFAEMGVTGLDELRPTSIFTETVQTKNYISQQSAVRFFEEGAEASSVTITGGASGSHVIPNIRFDQPFLFMINETSTGAAILWGCIRDL